MHAIVARPEHALLEVILSGDISFDERRTTLDEVRAQVKHEGWSRLLITYEVSARVAIPPFEHSSRMASALVASPLVACRTAYVTPAGVRIDPVTETLAYARGFQGERFTCRDAALAWLLG